MQACLLSAFDFADGEFDHAAGGLRLNGVAHMRAHERSADGGLCRDVKLGGVGLGEANDDVLVFFLIFLVEYLYDGTDGNGGGGNLGIVNDDGVG